MATGCHLRQYRPILHFKCVSGVNFILTAISHAGIITHQEFKLTNRTKGSSRYGKALKQFGSRAGLVDEDSPIEKVLEGVGKDLRKRSGHLPVDREAVDDDREPFLRGGLAEPFHKNENSRCLSFMQARILAQNHIVEEDVDVGNFVRMEGCDHCV